LAMVTDFWSCKTQPGTKYLGLRVYLVDSDWNYRSVLLGTRHFQPLYGERSGGYRTPFKRWILELLHDFGLELTDFYGSTTDSGPDVKWMMRTGLSLRWEWCMPHLTNAATKMAFGIVPQRSESKNLPLTDLISRILQIIYAIRSNEAMGSLFSELCALADPTGTTQLLSFKDHRFMGLTRVIRRILEKWEPLEQWFDERRAKAIRACKASPRDFPLEDDKETLLQLLALLDPITTLNIRAQSESPNQVEVLLTLYRLRVTILDETMGLKDRLRGRDAAPLHYRVSELTPEVRSTRHLLAQAFHKNFFSRYTDRAKMRECSYIPEAQMCLHPVFKNPDRGLTKVVRLSSTQLLVDPKQPHLRLDEHTVQRNVDKVKECVRKCITSLMMSTAEAEAVSQERQTPTFLATTTSQWMMATTASPVAYSEELTDLFGETPSQEGPRGGQEGRVEEELDRWLADTISLDQKADKTTETLLEFWHRQEETNNYHLLPRVARILFAIPSLSASIERDFGVSGMMVTAQRTSLAKHNIEMCSFLNRNSSFTQLTQCKPLMDEEYENAVPASMLVSLEPPPRRAATFTSVGGANGGYIIWHQRTAAHGSGRLGYDFVGSDLNDPFALLFSAAPGSRFPSWDFNVFTTDPASLTQLLEEMNLEFGPADYRHVRKMVTTAILGTDMANHVKFLKPLVKVLRPSSLHTLVHASDLSGQVFPNPVALKWSNVISKEFAYQALLEQAENIPLSYSHIDDPMKMVEGQLFFAQKIVSPLWDLMYLLFPDLDVCMANRGANVKHYELELQRLKLAQLEEGRSADEILLEREYVKERH
ncbi:hypothetical protein BBJ28_00022105, partial [Nothophytophthora sp. Chile5]